MMNKPAGYVSANEDKHYPVVIDLLPEKYRHYNPFCVGRLDIDTEGLLLITNDGEYAHKMTSPKKEVYKKYFARLDKPAEESADYSLPPNSSIPSMISMYLGFSSSAGSAVSAPKAQETAQASYQVHSVQASEKDQHVLPQKIYLRVSDMTGEVFKKAKNIVDIFNEGTMKVVFYDSSSSKYSEYIEKMFYSEYAIKELKRMIGNDNVVCAHMSAHYHKDVCVLADKLIPDLISVVAFGIVTGRRVGFMSLKE